LYGLYKIDFLHKNLAIQVAQKQIDWFDNGFKQVFGKFNKRRLLVWLFGLRERKTSDFDNCWNNNVFIR